MQIYSSFWKNFRTNHGPEQSKFSSTIVTAKEICITMCKEIFLIYLQNDKQINFL